MHFGVYVPIFGPYADARVLAALAKDAEAAGWEGFFLWDHVFTDWPDRLVDPWVALTAIALNTENMRLGTLVTPLPRRRPWKQSSPLLVHLPATGTIPAPTMACGMLRKAVITITLTATIRAP